MLSFHWTVHLREVLVILLILASLGSHELPMETSNLKVILLIVICRFSPLYVCAHTCLKKIHALIMKNSLTGGPVIPSGPLGPATPGLPTGSGMGPVIRVGPFWSPVFCSLTKAAYCYTEKMSSDLPSKHWIIVCLSMKLDVQIWPPNRAQLQGLRDLQHCQRFLQVQEYPIELQKSN